MGVLKEEAEVLPSQVEETSHGSGIIIYADDSDYYMVTNIVWWRGLRHCRLFADDETYEAQFAAMMKIQIWQ